MSSTSSPLSHPLALRISLSATSPTSCAPARGMRRSGPERRRQAVLQRARDLRERGRQAKRRHSSSARRAARAAPAAPKAPLPARHGMSDVDWNNLKHLPAGLKRGYGAWDCDANALIPPEREVRPPPRPEARAAPRPARAMQHLTAFYCRYAAEGAETEHGAPERGAKGLDASLHLRNASSSRKGFARQRALQACFAVAARRNVSRHARGTQSAAKGVDNTARVPLDSGCPPKWRFSWHACGGTARAGDQPPCAR